MLLYHLNIFQLISYEVPEAQSQEPRDKGYQVVMSACQLPLCYPGK